MSKSLASSVPAEPDYRPVPGSAKAPLPGSYIVGIADPRRRIEVTVQLRPRSDTGDNVASTEELGAQLPRKRQYLTRDAFARTFGADPADVRRVASFARAHGLRIVGRNLPARTLHLAGTIAHFSKAFQVTLSSYRYAGGFYRGRVGTVSVPADLDGIIEGVFGLDNRPAAKPQFRARQGLGGGWPLAVDESYSPTQISQFYNFPAGDGTGQCVGVIELGGGYRIPDLNTYFKGLGIVRPQIVPVPVQGSGNHPTGHPRGPDGEVMLDIEIVGSLAPAAKIVVYFAPNTDQGFLRAVNRAVHDNVNRPSIISISWGRPEETWTHQSIHAFERAFRAAALLGVTVCVATGDGGYTDGVAGTRAHVDFPSSSPHVLACGGTALHPTVPPLGFQESAWNDGTQVGATGGGISSFFQLPVWQKTSPVPPSINPSGHRGRGLPDVAADASVYTGYQIRVDGVDAVMGGTSAAAPLWAALIARINQTLGKPVGYLNPLLYASIGPSGTAFNDVTTGNNDMTGMNGGYAASAGWDACTGFGSPNGASMMLALQADTPAALREAIATHHARAKRATKSRRTRKKH